MRSTALRRLAPVLVLAALLGSACDTTSSNAATVNGHDISSSSLTDELKTIRCSSAYRTVLEQSYGGQLAGASEGTFDANFAGSLLTVRIYYRLLESALATKGVKVTDTDVETARKDTDQQIDSLGKSVHCLPASYRKTLARQTALFQAAQARVQSQQEFEQFLLDTVCGRAAHVSVNPAYGRWDRSPCAQGAGLARVTPPQQPASSKPASS